VTKGGTQPYNDYNKCETYNHTEAFTYWNMECNLKVKILTYARLCITMQLLQKMLNRALFYQV